MSIVRLPITHVPAGAFPCPSGLLWPSPNSPRRVDTRLLFPAPSGGRYALGNFRRRSFDWAVSAAGPPESTTPYTLRHSGISWALSASIPATDVARFAGTSLAMLERVYHHLLVSSAESARERMDEFASRGRLGQESAAD
jgi:integrase